MAEKPEELVTSEEKIAKAKELYGRGCRNYYVKSYAEATEDLSQACTYYSEVYGPSHEELGEVYLLYGKALIAVGQEENKLIDVPEDDSEEGAECGDAQAEGEDDESEEGSTENGDDKKDEEELAKDEEDSKDSAEASEAIKNGSEEKKEQNGQSMEVDAQPGPSGLNGKSGDEETNEEEDDGNLQVAWEVLEIAADIFEKQGEKAESQLLEAYSELAGISVENGNFDLAIKDFGRAMHIYAKMAEPNKRIGAEMYYKLGLCQVMIKLYDESVKSFQKAHDLLNDVLEKEKMKEEKCEETISDLEELKQEIQNKILEVGDVKAEEVEQVKKELSKFFNHQPESSDGAGCSSSSTVMKSPEAEKPKPTDISHLIKRKKPDAPTSSSEVESSPAKKVALDNSK